MSATPVSAQPVNELPPAADRFSFMFTLAAIAMCSVAFGVGRYAYGLFLPAIRQDFGASTVALGLIASLSTLVYFLTTIIASTLAIHFKPRTFMLAAGIIVTTALSMVGLATSLGMAAAGIVLAGVGGGIYSPALFEAIDAWLPGPWRDRAIAAVNAGSTPGLVVTGMTAYLFQTSWQRVWLVMGLLAALVTWWHASLIPDQHVAHAQPRVHRPLSVHSFTRPECWPLYGALLIYGLLFSVYLTFAVDLILTAGGLTFPVDRLFWALLGLAGMPTIFAGVFILRFGVRALLLVSVPLCGLSYVLLAYSQHSHALLIASAILFGWSAIAPGGGFYLWGIRLFPDRPSIGTACVTLCVAVSMMLGPTVYGLLSPWVSLPSFFLIVGLSSLAVIPLIPRDTSPPAVAAAPAR